MIGNTSEENTGERTLIYTGPSMNPTLREPDLLFLKPPADSFEIGDIIAFRFSNDEPIIVHRIIKKQDDFYLTQGDHNLTPDFRPVSKEHIIGIVDRFKRNGEFYHPQHENQDVWQNRIKRVTIRRKFEQVISRLLHPLYHLIANTGIIAAILKPLLPLRLVRFANEMGTEIHVYLRNKRIGRKPAGKEIWLIKKPFRVFINANKLPTN